MFLTICDLLLVAGMCFAVAGCAESARTSGGKRHSRRHRGGVTCCLCGPAHYARAAPRGGPFAGYLCHTQPTLGG